MPRDHSPHRRLFLGQAAGALTMNALTEPPAPAEAPPKEAAYDPLAKLCDFPNSYMTFTSKGARNIARIQLDARCVRTDRRTGKSDEYFLITPCRSERMYVEKKL